MRRLAGIGGGVAFVVVLCPPVITGMGRHGYLEVIQFVVLALLVPPAVVAAGPLRWTAGGRRFAERLGERRRRHATFSRAARYLGIELLVTIGWRLPVAVDALVDHRLLVIAEVLTLVPAGIGLWLELIDSPPLTPRLSPSPARALVAALTMWASWIVSYLAAFSTSWYPVYSGSHVDPGVVVTDQQIMSGVVFLVAAAVFLPVIFVTLRMWLDDSDRPDAELRRLVREERRRAFGPPNREFGNKMGGTRPWATGNE
ncbi:MAG: cytochrome c oxidase assembly protein [Actinomycetota bacterium]|nr:cytochrome c oxidase assembly protein [Actinomycetota bacterium]